VTALLAGRNVTYTDLTGWHRLDQAERDRGEARGRERLKVVPREDMLQISLGE
jgi:ferredoxin--NADP+ reductase